MDYLNLFLPGDALSNLTPSQLRVGLDAARTALQIAVGPEKLVELDGHLAGGRLADAKGIVLGSGKMESLKNDILRAIVSA